MRSFFAFLIGIILSGEAAALEKCVEADGKISYRDLCPPGTRAPSSVENPPAPKPSPPGATVIRPELKPTPQAAPGERPPAVTIVPVPPPPPAPPAPPVPAAAKPAPATLAPFVPSAPADVRLAFYDVEGGDQAALLAGLRARDTAAESSWQLSYQYVPRSGRGACAIGTVTTKLELAMTLPRWSPPQGTPPELLARWERYVKALAAHENARLERARELEGALKPALAGLAPAADCGALDAAVKERYAALERETRARDAEPDAAPPAFD